MKSICDTVKMHANVQIGDGCVIEDYAIIGVPPRGKKSGELKTVIGRNAVIRSHTVVYAGNLIGNNFQTGHGVMIREENSIGNDVSVGSSSIIEHHVKIANGVRMHSQVFVPEYSVLDDNCWLGPRTVLTNAKYPMSPNAKNELKGATIGKRAKVGANATILPGVVLGEDVLVGAGSVVTKDVSPRMVVAGNPAKVIKSIDVLPYSNIRK